LQELQEFVQRNPASEQADDAQYLIGEVYFSQEQYEQAVQAFDQVVQNYPQGDKVPAAFLKKGLALLEMNRTADAVIQLQHVITAYPRSEEARVARARLQDLGLRER
ncbi:MAG TPA: tol-pal system protein YbgF, partial [Candidatus Polarisedimenticolia bacterium]|nr:tol-pal system protein YbgF [Candidatus Polarisedimenticolia bacterium]